MPEVNGRTLMMAIQAVDFKISDIVKNLDTADDTEGGELELLLLSYEKAAASLKIAYEEAQKSVSNLPPYDTLVSE
ncbi:MAG: hypothetical protein RL748_2129 [Pseudomonadota bacterium]|jgi:hypothetical protein